MRLNSLGELRLNFISALHPDLREDSFVAFTNRPACSYLIGFAKLIPLWSERLINKSRRNKSDRTSACDWQSERLALQTKKATERLTFAFRRLAERTETEPPPFRSPSRGLLARRCWQPRQHRRTRPPHRAMCNWIALSSFIMNARSLGTCTPCEGTEGAEVTVGGSRTAAKLIPSISRSLRRKRPLMRDPVHTGDTRLVILAPYRAPLN